MEKTPRQEFLLCMYTQLWSNINRHITVSWESITTVIGAVAIMALVEKQILSLDLAVALVIAVCTWAIAHLYDSAEWFNRNLVIIANIERQFLEVPDDLSKIHYFFAGHRGGNKMLRHFRIQYFLIAFVLLSLVMFHFAERVWPGVKSPLPAFELSRSFPYLAVMVALVYLVWLRKECIDSYQELLDISCGKDIRSKIPDELFARMGKGHPINAVSSRRSIPKRLANRWRALFRRKGERN